MSTVPQTLTVKRKPGANAVLESHKLQDIEIWQARVRGATYKELMQRFDYKHMRSIELAVKRGKKLCIERGIDTGETKVVIQQMFQETLGALMRDVHQQAIQGQVREIHGPDGLIQRQVTRGVNPRTASELARSLTRWAEFAGLLEARSSGDGSVTMVQLNMPSDGAQFAEKWQTVDEVQVLDNAAAAIDSTRDGSDSDSSAIQQPDSSEPQASSATVDVSPIQPTVSQPEPPPAPKLTATQSVGQPRRSRARTGSSVFSRGRVGKRVHKPADNEPSASDQT